MARLNSLTAAIAVIAVTALADRRFRAGIEFGRERRLLDPVILGDDRLDAIVADPFLHVEASEDEGATWFSLSASGRNDAAMVRATEVVPSDYTRPVPLAAGAGLLQDPALAPVTPVEPASLPVTPVPGLDAPMKDQGTLSQPLAPEPASVPGIAVPAEQVVPAEATRTPTPVAPAATVPAEPAIERVAAKAGRKSKASPA